MNVVAFGLRSSPQSRPGCLHEAFWKCIGMPRATWGGLTPHGVPLQDRLKPLVGPFGASALEASS
eukprot:7470644-Pyramimonas_sp.AAC.1